MSPFALVMRKYLSRKKRDTVKMLFPYVLRPGDDDDDAK